MKRFISLIVACCMLTVLLPASSVRTTAAVPSIEDILNDYHTKAFEAQTPTQDGNAVTYSRSTGGNSKTLEHETVDTLTAAGYEAYNVTSDNYDTLEKSLQTDFVDMGLDPDGSYIVVISGEESDNANNANSRAGSLIDRVEGDPELGTSAFRYTYNGTTYIMRYVTVTAATNNLLGMVSSVELLDKYDVEDAWNSLNLPITIMSSLGLLPYTGTIYSLFSAIIPDIDSPLYQSLIYQGASNWTIKYIQIYDSDDAQWELCGGVEYVTMRHTLINTYYNPSSNSYETETTTEALPTIYSRYYNDLETAKGTAAEAYSRNYCSFDTVDDVEYLHDQEVVITHQRWMESFDYEPA